MNDPVHCRRAPPRRLVLALAVLAGLAATLVLGPRDARDARSRDAGLSAIVAEARAQPAAPPAAPEAAQEPPAATPPAAAGAPAKDKAIDAEITIDQRGVTVRKGKRNTPEAHVIVGDQEFDSFEQFVERAPWLAGLVFMVTALVFLVPLVVIVLVIWYKMRRTRMMNETMLKLAERGVVPPAEAMEAIASGRASLQDVPPAAPLYEQAKTLRKRAAWSDLRKGVLIGGVGLGLAFWGMLDDGSPNGLGLILLFVGIGYTILWYLEERPGNAARDRVPPPGGA